MQVACWIQVFIRLSLVRCYQVYLQKRTKTHRNLNSFVNIKANTNIFILLQLTTTLVFRVDRNLAIPEILECNSLRGAIANVASRDEHVKEHACGVSSRYRITTCVRQVLRVLAATVIPALRKSRNAS